MMRFPHIILNIELLRESTESADSIMNATNNSVRNINYSSPSWVLRILKLILFLCTKFCNSLTLPSFIGVHNPSHVLTLVSECHN